MRNNRLFQHLHRYKYLWSKCIERDVIIAAWNKLRKGKTNRKEVIAIEREFEHCVRLMQNMIRNTRPGGDPNKAFWPKILLPKTIIEHGKERTIYCPPIWDQWVHHIIVFVLAPIVERFAYKFSCGSMPKRGGVYGKNELTRTIKKKPPRYFLKLDIRHFFNNTRIDVVISELRVFIDDNWFIYLIKRVFIQFPKSLPLGFYISQWLANFVLCRVDWRIKRIKGVTCFIRYMDDYILTSDNKFVLRKAIYTIGRGLGQLKLKLKDNYQVCKFEYFKHGKMIGRAIDFMGFKFRRFKTILRKRVMIRSTHMAFKLKRLRIIALRQAQGMLSRLGWYKHTQSKWVYINYIQPNVSIKSLKTIVRKDSLRRNEYYEFRMERRIINKRAA